MSSENPKLFISYSWSSKEHIEWVISLASKLRESGVDALLDKWDLKAGHDAFAFMEKMVSDPEIKKVAIICDKHYCKKADERKGGVGAEAQIITPELYGKQDQDKFVAIVKETSSDGKPCLPLYYKSRIYIDLSDEDVYSTNYKQLLHWIYDEPMYVKPKLGKKPNFVSVEKAITLGIESELQRAQRAVRENATYADGAVEEYFESLVNGFELFRMTGKADESDDVVVDNIEKFIPYRNEAVELLLTIARYRDTQDVRKHIHHFFEALIPYMFVPESQRTWQETDFDNFRFIVHELFLYAIASLIKYQRFEAVAHLTRYDYYVERNRRYGNNLMEPFTIFNQSIRSLLQRNDQLQLRLLSPRATLLEERSHTSGLDFNKIMEADFTLYITDCLNCVQEGTRQKWVPDTLLYAERLGGAFETYARTQSKTYFDRFKAMLNIDSKDDLNDLVERLKGGQLFVPQWEFRSFDPVELLGFEKNG